MGLFDKKYCDVCGAKIGLLGNRKLADGNLCKDCAGKLSTWFSERRHSTVADIKAQLADREANVARVKVFNWTKKLGKGSQAIYVDEANGTFTVCSESELKIGNPDILPLSCITACNTRQNENRVEKKQSKDGKMVSYNPPQYEVSYDFYCEIKLDHPYIEEINFRLNLMSIKQGAGLFGTSFTRDFGEYQDLMREIPEVLNGRKTPQPTAAPSQGIADGKRNDLEPHFVDFPMHTYPFTSYEGEMGELTVTAKLEGKFCYHVTNEEDYNDVFLPTHPDVVEFVHMGAMQAFWNMEAQKKSAMDLRTGLKEFNIMIADEVNKTGILENYGIEMKYTLLKLTFDDESEAMLKKIAMFNVMKAGGPEAAAAAMTAASTAAAATAQTTAVPVEWECPACKAKNTGKFCEYCGTPRP